MAGSLNKVTLIGTVGRDPEVRSFSNGGRVANLSIATSESWKDKATGEKKEKTEWHRIAIWQDGLVGVVENYVRKGSKIYLEGQLETRKYQDKDGIEKYSTEIVLKGFGGKLILLTARGDGAGRAASDSDHKGFDAQGDVGQAQTKPAQGGFSDMDDEIPF